MKANNLSLYPITIAALWSQLTEIRKCQEWNFTGNILEKAVNPLWFYFFKKRNGMSLCINMQVLIEYVGRKYIGPMNI